MTGMKSGFPPPPTAIQYRADIDGLRAVAVVPVILYHAGVPQFGGGFVGVDVFFVISGYLITSLIAGEIASGRFSVLDFYQRRCRRILPALYAVMTFCAVVGYLVYAPADLKRLGQAIVGTTLFLSNVVFWLQTGYFGAQFDELPLLHTWSLAVEEQFYATFPLYLLFVSRFMPSHRRAVTLTLCGFSFALSAWSVHVFPEATFFLPITRAWELLIGALLAIDFVPKIEGAKWRHLAGVTGLAMIGAAVFGYSERTPFPGTAALLPVLGATLVIWAGIDTGNPVKTLLSQRWIVFLGKISYSLYLWHFPLLAFASYLNVTKLSLRTTAAVLALSLGVSLLSWFLVEQPFRRAQKGLSPNRLFFPPVAIAMCVFCAVGLYATRGGGLPDRLTSATRQILAEADDFDRDRLDCALYGPAVPTGQSCWLGHKPYSTPQFVLWGDSHAEAWRPAFDEIAARYNKTGIFVGRVACAPIIEIDRLDEPECATENAEILRFILSTSSIRTVVLSARWGLWAEGSRYKKENRKPPVVYLVPLNSVPAGPKQNRTVLAFGLHETIATLRGNGKEVWLIGPVPEIGYPVPRSMYIQKLGINPSLEIRPTREEYQQRQSFIISLFDRLQKEFHVKVIWPDLALCNQHYCQIEQNGKPLYIDDNHLSVYGAKSLDSLFKPIFE
jgi:peptidoglycan/LPS O-acetylase OafA/YrhL